jgi:hypothetical protein
LSQSPQPVFVRQQLLIDEKVQGSLLKRAGLYSAACAVYFMVILIFAETMSRPDANFTDAVMGCFGEAVYWAPGLLLMAPLIAYDMLKQTNRFAGPVFRMRREMQRLIAGESERPLNFRDNDYWTEMADEFNKIREELIQLRQVNAIEEPNEKPITEPSENKLFDDNDEEEVGEDDLLGSLVG